MKNIKTNVGSFATAKLQAKRRSLLAIIALVAVIGFSMVSCEDDGGNGDGNKGSSGLTITGIPAEFNGKFAIAGGETYKKDLELFAGASIDMKKQTVTAGKISGGKVALNVWKVVGDDNVTSYSGNDTVVFDVIILSKEKIDGDGTEGIEEEIGITQVTFKNGVGTGTFQYEGDEDE
jgi:hypothetical protein